jgi:hypothetical protein
MEFLLSLLTPANITFVVTVLSSPFWLKIIDYIIKKIEQGTKKKQKLLLKDSEIFYVLKRSLLDIDQKRFSNDFKTAVGRDLLRIKFQKSYETIQNWVMVFDENKIANMSNQNIKIELINLIRDLIIKYQVEWRAHQIPETVTNLFNEYHRGNEQWVIMTVENLLDLDHYDNVEKVYYAFKAFTNAFNRAFFDSEEVFRKMNGSLTGTSYKGIICK